MATTKLTGRQLNFQGAAAFTGSNGAANGIIFDNGSGLVLSASRVYLGQEPADNLEAATKAYVDSVAGGGVTANQIAFGNSDGSGVSSDAGLVYNPNTDTVGVSGSINFGDGSTANFIYGSSTDGLRLSGSKVDVTSTGAVSIDAVGTSNVTTNGALTISGSTGLNLDADSGTLSIQARLGAVDVDAVAGSLSLDGAGGINIGTAADVAFDIDSAAFDLDASGAITIDGTSTFSVDAVGTSNVTTKGAMTLSGSSGLNLHSDSGVIDIDSRQGAITIDSNAAGISIDAAAASNFTTSAGDLTVQATSNSVVISAAESVTDAIQLGASNAAGGIQMSVQGGLVAAIEASTFSVPTSTFVGTTGQMFLSGASRLALPQYLHNSAVAVSGSGGDLTYGDITAGSGLKSVSLMTGSILIEGSAVAAGVSGLEPSSLQVFQNGLLLASGSSNDYTISNYSITSGSNVAYMVDLYTAPVTGDVFQVRVSSQNQPQ